MKSPPRGAAPPSAARGADEVNPMDVWSRPFKSYGDIPRVDGVVAIPKGRRGTITIEEAPPPKGKAPKGRKGKQKKQKAVPAVYQAPAAFPNVTLPFDMPASQRINELLSDPSLLDGKKAVALSAHMIEAAMSDGIHPDDMRFNRLLDSHQKLLLIAYKQAATEAVIMKGAMPVFNRLGALMGDIINRHVPAAGREMAIKELRVRLREAMENVTIDAIKDSGSGDG